MEKLWVNSDFVQQKDFLCTHHHTLTVIFIEMIKSMQKQKTNENIV